MVELRRNFSRGVLMQLAIVLAVSAALLLVNAGFITDIYLRNQPTATGWIINGGILMLFLLGLARIVAVLLRYLREEEAMRKFVRALQGDQSDPVFDSDPQSLIGQRYQAIRTLGQARAPIHHAALASVQAARESTFLSFPRFIHNILILTGVFGTIVSLSIALLGASNLMEAAPGEDSMGLIIHGMSTALSTTITAIVCYLVYGYFYLKLADAQTHVLGSVEQVTNLYLLPRYAHSDDTLGPRLSGLVKGLCEVVDQLRTAQTDHMAANTQLHSLIAALHQGTKPMSDDLKLIKLLLREGFRLPESRPGIGD